MSFGYTFSTVNIKNTMHTYIHKNLLDTSKHFFEKFNKNKVPPPFRTRRSDAIFFKLLEFHYCILLDFCCSKRFLKTKLKDLETIHTFSGYMSYHNQEWNVKNLSAQPIIASKTLLKVQNKLQKLLETSLHPSSETYKTFDFQLTATKTNTHVFGVYYKDEKDKTVFYFFDCRTPSPLISEETNTINNKEEEKFCETTIKNLIDQVKKATYKNINQFTQATGKGYNEINAYFKKHYNTTLFSQYKTQRLLFALEQLLFTNNSFKEIQINCLYNYYQIFNREFKEDYCGPKETRRKIEQYKKAILENKGDVLVNKSDVLANKGDK